MDSRLRGRPERPRFVAPVDDNLFDYYGDAMFGFGDYDGTQYDTQASETTEINNRPSANVQVKSGGTSGYCRICDGEDAANCATRSAGKSIIYSYFQLKTKVKTIKIIYQPWQ